MGLLDAAKEAAKEFAKGISAGKMDEAGTRAGLIAAEALERDNGPFVALPAFKRAIGKLADPVFNARATLGALRCSVQLGDEREIQTLCSYWSKLVGAGPHLPAITELCKQLARNGRKWLAVTVAGAETERERTARAFYLWARCLEVAGDGDGAQTAFGTAAELADKEQGASDVALAARARRVERMLGDKSMSALVIADAQSADPTGALPSAKLVIALGRLRSASRFVRSSGLSLLEEVARDPTTTLGKHAIRLAAEHADTLGDALTPVEADRIAATLGHIPDEDLKTHALARLSAAQAIAAARGEAQTEAVVRAGEIAPEIFPLVCRARAALAGGGQGAYTSSDAREAKSPSPSIRIASLGLDAIVALGRGRAREAASALVEMSDLLATTPAAPPVVWTAALSALEVTDPVARDAGVRLSETLLTASLVPPLRGFSGIARALERAHRPDLAAAAARSALSAKEPGARLLLGEILRNRGWALAAKGQRDDALTVLREAKELLTAAAAEAKGR